MFIPVMKMDKHKPIPLKLRLLFFFFMLGALAYTLGILAYIYGGIRAIPTDRLLGIFDVSRLLDASLLDRVKDFVTSTFLDTGLLMMIFLAGMTPFALHISSLILLAYAAFCGYTSPAVAAELTSRGLDGALLFAVYSISSVAMVLILAQACATAYRFSRECAHMGFSLRHFALSPAAFRYVPDYLLLVACFILLRLARICGFMLITIF